MIAVQKILITGHRGFIGSRLYEKLIHNEVTGFDLIDGNDLLTCELPNEEFDLIIHLAGKSGVRESLDDPASYWQNNVEASRRLFERYADTRILYASSSSAYEPDLNPYAASKYIIEELAARYPNTLGMRYHTVFSETPRKGMFLDKVLNNELEYVTTHHRDFIHLDDVCDAIKILINKPHVTGIVDIGTGNPIRVRDLVPNAPIRLNTPHERKFTCANIDKMKVLGFKPKYTIENFLTKPNKGIILNITNGEPA